MKYYNFCRIYDLWIDDIIGDFDLQIEKTFDPITADILIMTLEDIDTSYYPNTKYIICPCTNTNHINNVRNVPIFSLQNEFEFLKQVTSTAEHTIRLMLDIVRPVNRNWNLYKRPSKPGRTLYGKKLGIIGYGRIGQQVAKLAKEFGMKVLVADIKDKLYKKRLTYLLKHSDIITLHPSIKKNQKPIISENEISKMKDGVYLINTSRGEAIDERALYKNANKFTRIALDVVINDNFAETDLNKLDNCLITNHIGGYTYEDLEKTLRFCMGKLTEELS